MPKPGLIAEVKINQNIRFTFEWEGDLEELYGKIDDIFTNYQKVIDHRYPYESIFKRIYHRLGGRKLAV